MDRYSYCDTNSIDKRHCTVPTAEMLLTSHRSVYSITAQTTEDDNEYRHKLPRSSFNCPTSPRSSPTGSSTEKPRINNTRFLKVLLPTEKNGIRTVPLGYYSTNHDVVLALNAVRKCKMELLYSGNGKLHWTDTQKGKNMEETLQRAAFNATDGRIQYHPTDEYETWFTSKQQNERTFNSILARSCPAHCANTAHQTDVWRPCSTVAWQDLHQCTITTCLA